MIENVFVKNISGPKSYLIKDEEAYIVTKLEIYCAPGLPRDIVILTNEIQQVLYDVGKKRTSNGIQPKSAQRYDCIFIQIINREDEEAE